LRACGRGLAIVYSPSAPTAGGGRRFNPLALSEIQNVGDRDDIFALGKRLEARASVMPKEAARDLLAAALMLRLMVQLADVQEIETRPRPTVNDGQVS
jgi:hypothetical protein